jgi:hypothetical protein
MDDSFSLGQGAKGGGDHPAPKHAAPRKVGGTSFERTRLIWGAVGLALVALVVVGFLKFMGNAGKEIGADNQKMIEQVGAARDVQAQLTANQSIQNAMQVYEESGSFAQVTPQALAAAEPTFSYVATASTGPNSVSVAPTDQGVGLAVKSSSGNCLYAFVQASTTTYGTGSVCTGDAATGATDPSWPAS